MRVIDTDALTGVARVLGVGNPATAVQQVVFDDGNLQQVLDVGRAVARGRSPIQGIGRISLELVFSATGAQANTVNVLPYNAEFAQPPFPSRNDDLWSRYPEQDIYLLGASLYGSDASRVTYARLYSSWDQVAGAGTSFEPGVGSTSQQDGVVMFGTWNGSAIATSLLDGAGRSYTPINLRFPRPLQSGGISGGNYAGALSLNASVSDDCTVRATVTIAMCAAGTPPDAI